MSRYEMEKELIKSLSQFCGAIQRCRLILEPEDLGYAADFIVMGEVEHPGFRHQEILLSSPWSGE